MKWMPGIIVVFMLPVTMSAGYLNVANNFLQKGLYLPVTLSIVLMILMALFIDAFRRWYKLVQVQERVLDEHGELVLERAGR